MSQKAKARFLLILLLCFLIPQMECRRIPAALAPAEGAFQLEECTISRIHQAFRKGEITCRSLVQAYLNRIRTYDRPDGLNALVVINPDALTRADALDREFIRTGRLRPLHGIPIIVKDNYDTSDLPTAGGSIALKGSLPPDDAFQVRRIREAGAIILAKSNMAEWAFSPLVTESSLGGVTRNPYDLERVPAGSSGGTAAAVSANLGAVGLGTDTGNSIRGPSAHCGLVGIRSTMGLTSRDGIIPLYLRNDIGGPMARTVEDAARLLEVIAGYDPSDPVTLLGRNAYPDGFSAYLDVVGLKGARIGVFRFYTDRDTADDKVRQLFDRAIREMEARGAVIVDPFVIPGFDALTLDLWCDMFHHDINVYLSSLGPEAPLKTLAEIFESGQYLPSIKNRLERALKVSSDGPPACHDLYTEPKNIAFRDAVLTAMAAHRLEAIVYPTWSNPPRKIGDLRSPAGDNSQLIPPHTGLPAITVPMGFVDDRLPAGLQIVGRLFGEGDIIRIAYAYEQATKHRKPPTGFPPLVDEKTDSNPGGRERRQFR